MGREGALNQVLTKLGIVDEPVQALGFSTLSVRLAMVQLYILFMITPLFFVLAQVDRSALEAARDLGANGWRTFREVVIPQAMPGVVIGSIFIFVLTMGEYGTVRVIGGNTVSSVGTIVQSKVEIGIQYPQGAASAVLLVVGADRGRLRDHALLEPARGDLAPMQGPAGSGKRATGRRSSSPSTSASSSSSSMRR